MGQSNEPVSFDDKIEYSIKNKDVLTEDKFLNGNEYNKYLHQLSDKAVQKDLDTLVFILDKIEDKMYVANYIYKIKKKRLVIILTRLNKDTQHHFLYYYILNGMIAGYNIVFIPYKTLSEWITEPLKPILDIVDFDFDGFLIYLLNRSRSNYSDLLMFKCIFKSVEDRVDLIRIGSGMNNDNHNFMIMDYIKKLTISNN